MGMGKCLAAAAKAKVTSMLPTSVQGFLKLMGMRRLFSLGGMVSAAKSAAGKVASAAKGLACKAFGGKALAMCKSAVAAGVSKAAAAFKAKFPKIDLPGATKCFTTFGEALCTKAEKKACGRRLLSIPGPVKDAMMKMWNEVKPEAAAMGKCLAAAAKAKVTSMLPTSVQGFLKLMGMRRLFSLGGMVSAAKSAAGKAASAAKGLACKAFGGKALAMCKSAVAAGVSKAAAAFKAKFPKIDLPGATKCFTTLGEALCTKAEKEACGRRL